MSLKDRATQRSLLGLLFLVLLSSSYFISFDFIGIDDPTHILNNPQLTTWAGLLEFWKKPYFGLYIPVTYSVWWLLYQAFGASSSVFHGANIFVHAANGLLVYTLVKRIWKHEFLAFASSALFLLHPLQAASVAWVAELRGLLGAFFALLSFYFLLDYTEKKKWGFLLLWAGFYLASLFSKPSYIVELALSPLIFYGLSRFYQDKLFPILLGVLSLISTVIVAITKSEQETSNLVVNPLVIVNNLGFYVQKALVPMQGRWDYGDSVELMSRPQPAFLGCVLLLLFFMVFIYFKNRRIFILSLFFVIGFLPVLGFIPFAFQNYNTVADRYAYLPVVFSSLILIKLIEHFHKQYTKLVVMILGSPYFVFFVMTGLTYKNSSSFAESMISYYPKSFMGYTLLGEAQLKEEKFNDAEFNFLKALDIKPDYWTAHSQLGELYETQKRWQESLSHFLSIIRNEGGRYQTIGQTNLGEFYLRAGLAQMNLGQREDGLKNIEMGKTLAPERYQEMMK
jgi:hypothetical protein